MEFSDSKLKKFLDVGDRIVRLQQIVPYQHGISWFKVSFGINWIHLDVSKSYLLFEDYLEYNKTQDTVFLYNLLNSKIKRLNKNKKFHFTKFL